MAEIRTELPGGYISFEKKKVDDIFHLVFKARLPIEIPVEEIWEQLDFAFSGRENPWFWPSQYSRSKAVAGPLKSGGQIRTTYFFPSQKDPSSPPKESTYTYDMLRWEPDIFTLQYHTGDDHPFNGGATVSLEPISPNTCVLHWDGLYKMTLSMDKIADHFGWYFPEFITELKKFAEERKK